MALEGIGGPRPSIQIWSRWADDTAFVPCSLEGHDGESLYTILQLPIWYGVWHTKGG